MEGFILNIEVLIFKCREIEVVLLKFQERRCFLINMCTK